MRGLDDGPDGLNDKAFDRALGVRRPFPLTQHGVLLIRAQACVDHDAAKIALCDIALGRTVDLSQLPAADASRLGWVGRREAMDELAGKTVRP